jgi:hypothetical protein
VVEPNGLDGAAGAPKAKPFDAGVVAGTPNGEFETGAVVLDAAPPNVEVWAFPFV